MQKKREGSWNFYFTEDLLLMKSFEQNDNGISVVVKYGVLFQEIILII
jgi:hypothetical protein